MKRTNTRVRRNGSAKTARIQVPKTAEAKPEPWSPEAPRPSKADDGYVQVDLGGGMADGRFSRESILIYICKVVAGIGEDVYRKLAYQKPGNDYWAVRLAELYCVAKTVASKSEVKFPMELGLPGFAGAFTVGERWLLLRLSNTLCVKSERFLAMARVSTREFQLEVVDALALAEAVCEFDDRKLARQAQRLRADVMLGRVSRPLTGAGKGGAR